MSSEPPILGMKVKLPNMDASDVHHFASVFTKFHVSFNCSIIHTHMVLLQFFKVNPHLCYSAEQQSILHIIVKFFLLTFYLLFQIILLYGTVKSQQRLLEHTSSNPLFALNDYFLLPFLLIINTRTVPSMHQLLSCLKGLHLDSSVFFRHHQIC